MNYKIFLFCSSADGGFKIFVATKNLVALSIAMLYPLKFKMFIFTVQDNRIAMDFVELFKTIQSFMPGEYSSPVFVIALGVFLVLASFGIFAGGLAMLIGIMLSATARIKNTVLLLFGTTGTAAGAGLMSEDVRSFVMNLLGIGS